VQKNWKLKSAQSLDSQKCQNYAHEEQDSKPVQKVRMIVTKYGDIQTPNLLIEFISQA